MSAAFVHGTECCCPLCMPIPLPVSRPLPDAERIATRLVSALHDLGAVPTLTEFSHTHVVETVVRVLREEGVAE